MFALLRGNALIAAASFVTITGSQLLSLDAFATSHWYQDILLALMMTVTANVFFYAAAAILVLSFRLKSPGMILQTALGTIAGALAISLSAMFAPSLVLVGFAGAIFIGFFNTMLVWALAFGIGAIKPGLKLWPQFEKNK